MIFLSCHASDSLRGIKLQSVKSASTVYRCMTLGFLKELRSFLCPKLMSRQKKSINNTLTSLKFTTFITTRLLQVDDIYKTFRHYGAKKKKQIKYALSSSDSSSKSLSQFLWHVVPINCWLFLSSILTGFPEHSGGSTKGVQCLTHQQYTMNRADHRSQTQTQTF